MSTDLNGVPGFLIEETAHLNITETLQLLAGKYAGGVIFSTSFSYEDQVITDIIAKSGLYIDLFTLDTGRLFKQTYSVWRNTLERYEGLRIKTFFPDAAKLEPFLTEKGPDSFYSSVDNRKQCCYIRKVEPLKRAIAGYTIWITGLRAEHSANREGMTLLEWDDTNKIIKYNPLLHWTTEEVKQYISQHNVPYNILHDQGFVSIGCEPCTRAIRPGEDFRAGRWWWEDNSKKECGLHVHTTTAAAS